MSIGPNVHIVMRTSGICQVCGDELGTYTCESCGALVCAEHYDHETGLCVVCARGVNETR